MSRKYRKAMASKVDEDAWDLDRDAKFAMSILLPKTIDLLTAEEKPCFQDLLKLSWVKTNRPGIYSCMAWYVDAWGNLHVIIKVGCAWSEDGGLEQRRGQQLNDGVSKAEAVRGSPFHTFIQDAIAKGRSINYHWSTLAIGDSFTRRFNHDEYLPARFYQVEAMLAAAFGSSISTMDNPKYLALNGWPYVDPNSKLQWTGADSHCALQDIWPNPPTGESIKDTLHCPIDGCYKNKPGELMFYQRCHYDDHMAAHKNGTVKKMSFAKCFDPRCLYEEFPYELNKHQRQHIDGRFACSACNLQFTWSHDCEKHVQVCLVEDAIDVHKAAVESIKIAKKLVCGDHRCGHELEGNGYNASMMAIHRQMHVDGNHTCSKCGLKLRNTAVKIHDTKYCPGRSASVPVQPSTQLVCGDARCGMRYDGTNKQQINHYNKHVQSHIDGKFTCDCGLILSDVRRRAEHKRGACPGKRLAPMKKDHRRV
ncbi:hypothetical protein D6D23_10058 [Aureobasidium pullulans]|nr:hypothetical protein D6D23_10058 [Aureobasidium pullulans]